MTATNDIWAKLWRCGVVLLWIAVGALVRAHDPGISTAQGELSADALVLTTGFAPADAEQLLPPAVRPGTKWGQAEFDAVRDQLREIAPQIWEARSGEQAIAPQDVRVELLPGDNVSFRLVFPLTLDGNVLTLKSPKLPELPSGHRQYIFVSDERGLVITRKLLNAADAMLDVPLAVRTPTAPTDEAAASTPTPPASVEAPTFWAFVRLGVEHIWTGYDHLLFLFALLVVCRSFRSIVGIVSCFTVAHSITLALATLNIVNLPSRWVEAAIAASIVFVGVENLLRRGEEPKRRWLLTFAFGLIHGFGFASVLRDLGVGARGEGIAMPLFTFNLGVELGQIAIALVVLPIVWQLRKREAFVRRGIPVLSAIVALAGLYWLLERTIFG